MAGSLARVLPGVCFMREMVLVVSGVLQGCGAYGTGGLYVIIPGVLWSFRAAVRVIGRRGISGCDISKWASPVNGLGDTGLRQGFRATE